MLTSNFKSSISFLDYFDRFIFESKTGKRLQPNGKLISRGTLKNYLTTRRLLEDYAARKQVELRIFPVKYLNKKKLLTEKNYWKKFYKRFTDFLYHDRGHFDNSVGGTIKNIKTFFNYLNKDLQLGTGEFHKQFYVRKEEISIIVLLPEELNFLIYNKAFETKLSKRLKEAKDFFVVGCTVGLRFSDLINLKPNNIKTTNGDQWLIARAKKTGTDVVIKLPEYAREILEKYKGLKGKLLPSFNISNSNKYFKQLIELAGFTQEIPKFRQKRGRSFEMTRLNITKQLPFRFCDLVSTHTMRRTSITTMLSLGTPEQVVRKISGHSSGSKEFYRYIAFSQGYQDEETTKMFERLKEKTFN